MDSRQEKKIERNFKSNTSTLFNYISRDICNLIALELDARDLKSLCLASTSTNVQFYDALKLREDAHVILHEVLNGTLTSVVEKIEAARKIYGGHAWKLLVTPTYARELHNGRCWEAETVVCAAARAGDLYQHLYTLEPMPENDGARMKWGVLYVATEHLERSNQNILNYSVVNSFGEITRNTILESELGCALSVPLNLDKLKNHLPKIMAITYERDETEHIHPWNYRSLMTHLLNKLYAYIPLQHRPIANAQLQALHASKDFLSPYVELIAAYNNYVQRYDKCDSIAKDLAWQTDIGNRQKLLPWFGLRIQCDNVRWMPLPNFNHLPAPESIPVIYVNGKKELLRDQLPGLGECWAINHGTDNRAWQRSTVEGWGLCARAASALSAFVKAKCMQLSAFISWQKLAEKKYREEQTQSVALRRR